MRNKRETDISQYKDIQQNELSEKADGGAKRFFRGLGKFLITVCSVCLVAMLITGISLAVYIFTIASEPTGIDLKAKSMNQTSEYIFRMRIQRNLRSIRNYTIPRTESGLTIRIFLRQ